MGKRITHREFVENVHRSNPTIDVVGKYVGHDTLVVVKCKLCGHQWPTRPNNISRGRKCPACNRFKPANEFAVELQTKNNKVTLIGKYVSVKQKVLVTCNFCGREYFARPDILLEGMGCKNCSNASRRTGSSALLDKIKNSIQG